jgi:hypothetical protein
MEIFMKDLVGVNIDDLIGISIENAALHTGICRSKIYNLINSGKIDARKHGKSTIIMVDSLKKFLADLPSARSKKYPVPQLLNQKSI